MAVLVQVGPSGKPDVSAVSLIISNQIATDKGWHTLYPQCCNNGHDLRNLV